MTITRAETTELALDHGQTAFTEQQRTALAHIGVEDASEGDLAVFFHVVKRTGLDPFARQIYMISRQVSEKRGGDWVKVTKQTIQTGIDGFRLIGRRAADQAGHTLSVGAPEWADNDGNWRPVWSKKWDVPLAARVTITRQGQTFTAVAMFDEYSQTKRDGSLTQMWQQRPAGQIAKCAEAAAWRMAFPQDLSGIYADDEMQQADSAPVEPTGPRASGLSSALAGGQPSPAAAEPAVEVPPGEELLDVKSDLAKAMYAALREHGVTKEESHGFMSGVIGRQITSSKEMYRREAHMVLDALTPVDGEIDDDPSGPS